MELHEAISKRCSIRSYTDKKVTSEQILKLLESARVAPSAKNTQPWKFHIAKGEEKNAIADLMIQFNKLNPDGTAGMLSTAKVIKEAPVLILVFRDSTNPLDRNDTLSIGASIQNILLTATSLSLGSLWIAATYNVRGEISTLIGTDLELYSAIAIGYPNETPAPRPRKRLDEIIF